MERINEFWPRGLLLLLCSVLTVISPVALADEDAETANGKAANPNAGRIFTFVQFTADDGQRASYGLLSIDAATGRFEETGIDNATLARVSPDGHTLAYTDGNAIWTNNVQGDSPGKILDFGGMACWSPDGKELVCSTTKIDRKEVESKPPEKRKYKKETWRCNNLGDHPYTIPVPQTDTVEDWSPDGKWFVTVSNRDEPRGPHIYVMRTDGTQQRRLTKGRTINQYARFSPDGRQIVYLQQKDGKNRVRVVDFDGKQDRVVYEEGGRTCPQAACWSPDGKKLAIVVFDWPFDATGRRVLDTRQPAGFRFLIMSVDGRRQRELNLDTKAGVGWMYVPEWSVPEPF